MSIFTKISGLFRKKQEARANPGYCEHCSAPTNFQYSFLCKNCGKYHCPEHKLPEKHECAGMEKEGSAQ